jgi:membrane-associated phospholipid phosphatase
MSLKHAALGYKPHTALFVLPPRKNKPNDGTWRGWALGRLQRETKTLLWIQSWRCAALDLYMRIATFAGGELANVLVSPCLFWFGWLGSRRLAMTYCYSLASGFVAGNYLKNYMCLPRPVPPVWTTSARLPSDWSFPSTHSINALMHSTMVPFWLVDQGIIAETTAWIVAAVWFISIPLSRLYLGAHSPLDVAGAAVVALVLRGFWGVFAEDVNDLVLGPAGAPATSFPYVAAVAPLLFLLVHPVSTPPTPLTGDSATLLGMSTGITVGCYLAKVQRMSEMDTTHVPLARFATGLAFMLLVRAVLKPMLIWLCVTVLNTFSSAKPDSKAEVGRRHLTSSKENYPSPLTRKRVVVDAGFATDRTSVLDETCAEEDFFMNVDLPVKFGTYSALGFVGTYAGEVLFQYLGI